jgi:hypothetical protein
LRLELSRLGRVKAVAVAVVARVNSEGLIDDFTLGEVVAEGIFGGLK